MREAGKWGVGGVRGVRVPRGAAVACNHPVCVSLHPQPKVQFNNKNRVDVKIEFLLKNVPLNIHPDINLKNT